MKRCATILMLSAAMMLTGSVAGAAGNQFGVKGGIAVQKIGGDDVESDAVENRSGFVGGAFLQTDFSDNVGLRIEGLYFMKGASADSADVQVTIKLDYIEFPVLLMANVPIGDTGRLSLFGGPTLGFNVSAEGEVEIGDFSASADVDQYIKSFEFGLTFGAGISFDVGSVFLGVDGRYGFGLTTVAEDDLPIDGGAFGDATGEVDATNQGFAFMASIGFPIGAK